MKKVLAGILSTALALSLGATAAFAAGPGCGRYFADADGDGICDNAGSQCAYVDADGDGVCDVCGAAHTRPGVGRYFVDVDGDGVCDNYQSGQGRGCGRGGQCGRGNGFRGGRGR